MTSTAVRCPLSSTVPRHQGSPCRRSSPGVSSQSQSIRTACTAWRANNGASSMRAPCSWRPRSHTSPTFPTSPTAPSRKIRPSARPAAGGSPGSRAVYNASWAVLAKRAEQGLAPRPTSSSGPSTKLSKAKVCWQSSSPRRSFRLVPIMHCHAVDCGPEQACGASAGEYCRAQCSSRDRWGTSTVAILPSSWSNRWCLKLSSPAAFRKSPSLRRSW
mmetsp:Transcript_84678/g.226347  ORF Transcript_84678/g.226347 Transcript_84678/m.226347 type:complete len:216 (+) Transcript_84678:420-1067(+)